MKVGIVGDIHPSGYDFFDKNNIEYFVTNNIEENNLTKELSDVDEVEKDIPLEGRRMSVILNAK